MNELKHYLFLLTEQIRRSDNNATDKELVHYLQSKGLSYEDSVYIVLMFPIALGRIICSELNINFTNKYAEYNADGFVKEGFFSEHSIYNTVLSFAKSFILSETDKQLIIEVAGRSPEFNLVNQFLLAGEDVSKMKFSDINILL